MKMAMTVTMSDDNIDERLGSEGMKHGEANVETQNVYVLYHQMYASDKRSGLIIGKEGQSVQSNHKDYSE